MSDELLERLRKLLVPRYEVYHELGRGGMGIVYLGRHVLLDQLVAIKVLRPDLASALGIQRFLREPRLLAKLSHPHIVHVHDTSDDASEMCYYIMEYLEGETLEARIARGKVPQRDVAAIGRDVLAGLQFAHERKIIHRDVKPSNIFLVSGRAVLTDFGVAKSLSDDGLKTAPDQRPGTIPYMPPELLGRGDATPQSDIYSLAMVLYEAATGKMWDIGMKPDDLARARLEPWFTAALHRALEWLPEDRWPDAASFARALWVPRGWRRVRRPLAYGTTAPVLIVAVYLLRCPLLGICGSGLPRVQIKMSGGSPMADSVACGIARELDQYVDVRAGCPGERAAGGGPVTKLEGTIERRRDSLFVEVRGKDIPAIAGADHDRAWLRLVGRLADEVYARILVDSLDPLLPASVLPDRFGLEHFLEAERLLKDGQWAAAHERYTLAQIADPGCWMCYFRRAEVGQWLGLPRDSADVALYEAHSDSFPEPYRRLIRAQAAAIPARFDSLRALTRNWEGFLFGHFRYGDELLHRGPLVGRARREALSPFTAAADLKPEFAPAWEHLTWLWLVEGDSAEARRSLDNYARVSPTTDPVSGGLRALYEIAFAWRFLDETEARHVTSRALALADEAGAEVDLGPRFLVHFDAPRGAIDLARRLAPRPGSRRSALVAQVFAHLVLGRPDSARSVARALRDRFGEPGLGLFVEQLDAMLQLLGMPGGDSERAWPEIARALAQYPDLRAGSAELRRRAAWTLSLAALRDGDRAAASRHRALLADEPGPRHFNRMLRAVELAATGQYVRAVAVSDTLTSVLAPDLPDPFFRTVLHFLRAEWYERMGSVEAARRELLWHENEDREGFLVADPQPEEVDWAFGVEARWRQGRLLDQAGGSDAQRCRAYRDVASLWAAGDAAYAARAAAAGARRLDLGCARGQ